jgi:hypothetical protein
MPSLSHQIQHTHPTGNISKETFTDTGDQHGFTADFQHSFNSMYAEAQQNFLHSTGPEIAVPSQGYTTDNSYGIRREDTYVPYRADVSEESFRLSGLHGT